MMRIVLAYLCLLVAGIFAASFMGPPPEPRPENRLSLGFDKDVQGTDQLGDDDEQLVQLPGGGEPGYPLDAHYHEGELEMEAYSGMRRKQQLNRLELEARSYDEMGDGAFYDKLLSTYDDDDFLEPPATDFPETVPHFGVDCYSCQGVAACALDGLPQFCRGGMACFTEYMTPRREVVIRRGCGFSPEHFRDGHCINAPLEGIRCFCRSAPLNMTYLNTNYRGGRPNCNRRPVRKVYGRETLCYGCNTAEDCSTQEILIQCGSREGAPFMVDGCVTEYQDAAMTVPVMKRCSDVPSTRFMDSECIYQNATNRYRCFCRGNLCNKDNLALSTGGASAVFTGVANAVRRVVNIVIIVCQAVPTIFTILSYLFSYFRPLFDTLLD